MSLSQTLNWMGRNCLCFVSKIAKLSRSAWPALTAVRYLAAVLGLHNQHPGLPLVHFSFELLHSLLIKRPKRRKHRRRL